MCTSHAMLIFIRTTMYTFAKYFFPKCLHNFQAADFKDVLPVQLYIEKLLKVSVTVSRFTKKTSQISVCVTGWLHIYNPSTQ